MCADADEVLLRVSILNGPQDARWALQLGRADLLQPTHISADSITFDFTVRVDSRRRDVCRFVGPAAQGKTGAQFVYLNSGTYAGQHDSCWGRRAKVSLMTISPALLAQPARKGGRLQARIAGTARDGGPACASVALLEPGWEWVAERSA